MGNCCSGIYSNRQLVLKLFVEPNGIIPCRGKVGDAGLDCFVPLDYSGEIFFGSSLKIPLGFRYGLFWRVTTPSGETSDFPCTDYWLEIKNRSGVGMKNGFTELAAVCDAGYRGIPHYCVAKVTSGNVTIAPGTKICQALIHPFVDPYKVLIEKVATIEELGTTDRGDSGFGSTGVK